MRPELSTQSEPSRRNGHRPIDRDGDAPREAEDASAGRKLPRVNSLDALRGLLLIASVGVNSMVSIPPDINHHPWAGVNPIDLIFPIFVTMTGCGIAFAYRNGVTSWPRLLRRVVVLFVLGLLYNALTTNQWDLASWRITGVLQLYAVVIGVTSLAHTWFRTWRAWLGITFILSISYTVMTVAVASTCPGGALTPECNPSLADANAPWSMHVYRQGALGHDPEGMIATFGALISVSAGATIGHAILRGHARRSHSLARRAALIGGVSTVLALTAAFCVAAPTLFALEPTPIMKRLWTAPFALFVAAAVALALLALHAVIDDPRGRLHSRLLGISYPLLALGKNSLLVYFGSHIVNAWLRVFPSTENWVHSWLVEALGGGRAAEFVIPLAMILAWMVLAVVLHRRRIYVRA